jgi:hypothetical protein
MLVAASTGFRVCGLWGVFHEPLVLLGGGCEFAGASNGLPVFNGDGRLCRLERGGLVELDFVEAPALGAEGPACELNPGVTLV